MKHFKTKAGTELPLIDLRGKDYLQVAHRLVWFREEHPTWTIFTEIISFTENSAVMKATIKDGQNTISSSHKSEDRKGFADFLEKAETGAIGRALAACGYGTQFAPDLDENHRIVDSPVHRTQAQTNALPIQAKQTSSATKGDNTGAVWFPSKPQLKRLWAIAKESNWDQGDVRSYLGKLGLESTEKLTGLQYDAMIKNMQALPKGDSYEDSP